LPAEINFEAAAGEAIGGNDAQAGLTAATVVTATVAAPVPAVAAAKKNAGQRKYHASPKLLSQLQLMKKSPPSSQSGDAEVGFFSR
jgi:hypothetical protein